jgi:hypothetical protein
MNTFSSPSSSYSYSFFSLCLSSPPFSLTHTHTHTHKVRTLHQETNPRNKHHKSPFPLWFWPRLAFLTLYLGWVLPKGSC